MVLSDISFYVHAISGSLELPLSLVLNRPANLQDFPNLSPQNPVAYIYPVTDAPTSRELFYLLERRLTEGLVGDPFYILELEDPGNLDFVYILSHRNASQGLGNTIESSLIALFRFPLESSLGNRCIPYIKEVKSINLALLKEYQQLKGQILQLNQVLQTTQSQLNFEKQQNKNLKKEWEVTKKAINHLNSQLDKFSVRCEMCLDRKKDALLLPCGHLAGCKSCIEQKIPTSESGVPLNISVCFVCHNTIAEVKQVFY